jgi:hypothetical protein
VTPLGLLSLTLVLPSAGPSAPQWQRGDEFVYAGSVTEAVDRPGNRFLRAHDLNVRVFVLDSRESWADLTVLTLLRRSDDAVAGAVGGVTGPNPNKVSTPPLTRLDLVRVYADGTVHLLAPPGLPPLALGKDVPARVLPAIPLDSFPVFEFGMFPPRPRAGGQTWSVASTDPARPAETWHVQPAEFVNAVQCAKMVMVQQTADWEKPKGGTTVWQRVDTVWLSTRDGTTRRVHRQVIHRDGLADLPAVRIEVKYDIKDRGHAIGRTYDRYRTEIETAFAAAADLAQLQPDAARLGPKLFDARLERLDKYLADTEPGTPYREAVVAVRRRLDAARRGDASPVSPTPAVPPALPMELPEPGRPAPDFTAGAFQLSKHRGSPVVLVFFRPGSKTTDPALTIAEALHRRYTGRVAVVPLTVLGGSGEGTKDRERLKLSLTVHDGSAVGPAYGVETFPRFVVIDGTGVMHWQFHGVGDETGYLVCQELEKLLSPSAGTADTPGPQPTTTPTRP